MGVKATEVIKIALAEDGYLEKKSNSNLDSKTENAGSNNYTKYARDLVKWVGGPYANGAAWCDSFVDWVIIKACIAKYNTLEKALAAAKKLLNGWSAYTPTSASYYKKIGRWGDTPRLGAQIFFKNDVRINHTGIVYKIANGYVYTIEGNTSSAAGVVANGGCVRKKSYSISYAKIEGYGYPPYEAENEAETAQKTSDKEKFNEIVKSLKKAINAECGGNLTVNAVVDSKLLAATPTLNKKTRAKLPKTVRVLQQLLTYHGYKCNVDGDFYTATEKMVKAFQSDIVGYKNPDGEVTAKKATWEKLLKM